MADPRTPQMRHQHALLTLVASAAKTDGVTDGSLAEFAHAVGIDLDRSAVAHWRAGRREAPAWLLSLYLDHADPAVVLGALAKANGLRVVSDAEGETTSDGLLMGSIRAVAEIGDVVSTIRTALLDGDVSAEERTRIHAEIDEAIQALADLRSDVDRPVRAVR